MSKINSVQLKRRKSELIFLFDKKFRILQNSYLFFDQTKIYLEYDATLKIQVYLM